jgi:hypothetical protein
MRTVRRRIGSLLAAGMFVTAAIGLTGCGPTYTYLTSSSSQTYLAVPHTWRVFGQQTIETRSGTTGTGSFPYLVYFDGNHAPKLADSLSATAQPWGILRVRDLGSDEQGTYSFDSLDNELLELDQLTKAGAAQVVGNSELLTHGSLRGVRQEVAINTGGKTVLVDEAGYINNATTKVWSLLVGCSSTCFQQHHVEITRLVHSWTVGSH